ncbi:MMPL family transporter [Dactylosporangium vinaceum]|uniref:histidine kinase n=1 Tax=Dactylosporangium vinaceum TaxID=53362 RepID=A0ABV5M1L0_9ACTN|nr:MMPL family transporter [Dactylosporangium vinaceum]UAB99240.1 MMPL family transporter [Dactylosporangium vinaceum]
MRRSLLLGMLAVTAVVLLVAGVTAVLALRGYLLERTDDQITFTARIAQSRIEQAGDVRARVAPTDYAIELRRRDGSLVRFGNLAPVPLLDAAPPAPADGRVSPAVTLPGIAPAGVSPGGGDYRAVVARTVDGGIVLVALPLAPVDDTVRRLALVEIGTGAAMLLLLAAVGRRLVGRGLRPLEAVTETAAAIAAGDLDRRVPPVAARAEATEVGRLTLAVNGMLARLESALRDREASQERLRRFAADASHELRTPLTSIRGYLQLVRQGIAEPTVLARAEDETRRMGALVDDLLYLARLDAEPPLRHAPFDLVPVLRDAVSDLLATEPGRPATLELPAACLVRGDEDAARQIMANLLANVRAHTPPGTPVRVTLTRSSPAAPAGFAAVEVRDDGPGMPEALAARAFDRFARGPAAPAGAGSGLGLAIVAETVRAGGGTVGLTSAPGAGTTVRFTIPVAGSHPPLIQLTPASESRLVRSTGEPIRRSRVNRLGRWCATHPRAVLGAWLLVIAALVATAAVAGRPTDNDVTLPGSDAQTARDLLGTRDARADALLVLHAGSRLDTDAAKAATAATAAAVSAVPHVQSVAATPTLSGDGRTGYLTVTLDVAPRDLEKSTADAIVAAAAPARAAGIETVAGGALAPAADRDSGRLPELLGLLAAALLLLLAFGGVVAAAMPIATALFTLAGAQSVIGLAGHAAAVPTVATTLATMVGLGVGIDYALFLITRYRELLPPPASHTGPLPAAAARTEAIASAVADSGRAVIFAGGTVVIALGGLTVAGVPLLATLAWTTATAVLFAVAGAVTLLPALLALAGRRIKPPATPVGEGFWGRLAATITRRPVRYALATTALLALLAAPALDLHLGQTDAGRSPDGSAARRSFDLLSAGFGPGFNAPLTAVLALDPPATAPPAADPSAADPSGPRLAELARTIAALPGVAGVSPPRVSAGGGVASWRVTPTTAPGDPATADLVHRLRRLELDGRPVHVGGAVATKVDLAERSAGRLPLVIGVVVALSAALLLLAFRAPVVAVKAAVMNLVSIGAAYGALTAVFSWGWGVRLTGLDGPLPIESYVPTMLFALLFGLSMDYEVFLLTAVRQEYLRTGDTRVSVRAGLARTGRVITSAAGIMVVVFASFTLNVDPVVKMFGLGMAVAIAVDATVVRGLLVPATMALLGPRNWWPSRAATSPPPPAAAATAGPPASQPTGSPRR